MHERKQHCILARDTICINEYMYDVKTRMLCELIRKKCVVSKSRFKEFVIKEKNSNEYKEDNE